MEDNYSDELIHNLVKKQESYAKKEQPEIALILDDVLHVMHCSALCTALPYALLCRALPLLLAAQVVRGD